MPEENVTSAEQKPPLTPTAGVLAVDSPVATGVVPRSHANGPCRGRAVYAPVGGCFPGRPARPSPGCRICSAHVRLGRHSLITGSASQSQHCDDVIAAHPHRMARAR